MSFCKDLKAYAIHCVDSDQQHHHVWAIKHCCLQFSQMQQLFESIASKLMWAAAHDNRNELASIISKLKSAAASDY